MNPTTQPQMRCLVLGSGGFIGSHLVETLAAGGVLVKAYDRVPSQAAGAHADRIEYITGDFLDTEVLERSMRGCDAVFHLISTTLPKTSNDDPATDIRENLLGTIGMLEIARRCGVKKIIFLSSGGTVYGVPQSLPILEEHPTQPLNSYGIVKRTIEHYLELYHQLHDLSYQVVRLSNPFGPGQPVSGQQGVIAVFMAKALKGETIEIWGDGSVIRDYIYISDVVAALQRTLYYQGSCRIMNIGSGQGLSLNQVIDGIARITGVEIKRGYLPTRSFDTPKSVLSIERANRELDWHPGIKFEDGLAHTMIWIKSLVT